MKRVVAASVLAVLVTGFAARAQTDTPDSPGAAATAVEAEIPEASDAPVVNMQRFCARNSQRYYPPRALSRRADGDVVLDCAVSDEGAMRECQVVEEEPRRMGFGDASLTLACHLRVTSDTVASDDTLVYTRGGVRRVRHAVRWRLNL
jgi:hypothetical protein